MDESLPVSQQLEIETESSGVTLKQLGLEDAQRYFDLVDYDREHFTRVGQLTADRYRTVDDVTESLSKQTDRVRFGIWADGTMVGTINYEPIDDKAVEIGYWVGKEYTGHGYAGDAVSTLVPYLFGQDWQVVKAWAHADNMASRKTLLRGGLIENRSDVTQDGNILYELHNPSLP